METPNNPLATLLQQAMLFAEKTNNIQVEVDYEAISRAAIKAFLEEKEKADSDPRRLITQNEANIRYGKSVIKALIKRGLLQQHRFDTREVCDKDGEMFTKAKGVIYYRVIEIEKAVEDGNTLKGTRR